VEPVRPLLHGAHEGRALLGRSRHGRRGLGHLRPLAARGGRRGARRAVHLEPLRRRGTHALVSLRRQLEPQGPDECGGVDASGGHRMARAPRLDRLGARPSSRCACRGRGRADRCGLDAVALRAHDGGTRGAGHGAALLSCRAPGAGPAGVRRGPAETAREFVRRVDEAAPGVAAAFARLTAAYERCRFGADALTPEEAAGVEAAVLALRGR